MRHKDQRTNLGEITHTGLEATHISITESMISDAAPWCTMAQTYGMLPVCEVGFHSLNTGTEDNSTNHRREFVAAACYVLHGRPWSRRPILAEATAQTGSHQMKPAHLSLTSRAFVMPSNIRETRQEERIDARLEFFGKWLIVENHPRIPVS